jgi:PAS domain S-box-containing protein
MTAVPKKSDRKRLPWLHTMPVNHLRIVVFGCSALLAAMDSGHLLQERSAALDDARQHTASLTASLALHAEGVIRTTESVLADLAERLETEGWNAGMQPRVAPALAEQQAMLPWINFVAFYNAAGDAVITSGNDRFPANIAGRPFFADHRDLPDRAMRIGAPVQTPPAAKWIIPVTRRVSDAHGGFAGVVVAGLDVEHLLAEYENLGLPANGALALMAPDGTLLLRHPVIGANLGQLLGQRYAASPANAPLATLFDANEVGNVDQTSPIDGVTRLVSYRRFLNGLLVMEVGVQRSDVLSGWQRDVAWHVTGVATLVGLIAGLGLMLERHGRRRRALELRVARRQSKRQMLAQFATDIALEFDADLVCHEVGSALRAVFGHDPTFMLGTRMLDSLAPVDPAAIEEVFAATLAGEARAALITRLHHADGRALWMEIVLRLIAEEGEAPVILGVMRDVTARRAAEDREAAALAELQTAHATMLRAQRIAHEGHWRLDKRTNEMVWSGEVSRIFGIQAGASPVGDAITLDAVFARIHADERAQLEAVMRKAMVDGGAFQSEFRIVRPDGNIRYIACFGGTDHGEDGEPAGLIGTVQDITERAAQEQEQHHENKIRTIGRLASGVAHDFNNLLQSVTSCLELIGDQVGPDGKASEYVRIALEAAERGSYLTHHLLSYARKQILKPKRVLPEALVRDMQVLLERTLGPHIRVVVDINGPIPAIQVDPTHLQTALLNLGINSGHAMPRGGTLTLQVSIQYAPDPMVVLAVTDTGIGMDATTLAQATEPFFTTKGVEGTGLGLSMVNGFAHQSGGEMRIASRLGEGTRIELRLPAVLAREADTDANRHRSQPDGRRVLLVEDASDVRITTTAFLSAQTMQVTPARSGEEAVDHISRGERFDVILTDYAMPGINGIETIRRARVLQPGLPAVIITGYANIDDAATVPTEVEVLRKPFHRLDLLDALTRAIGLTSVAGASSHETKAVDPATERVSVA